MIDAVTTKSPPGKRCSRCLCCDAMIVFDGEALCAACDDGSHEALATKKAAVVVARALGADFESTHKRQPADPSRKGSRMPTTPEQIMAIINSDLSQSCRIVAENLGVHKSVVHYYRVKHLKATKAEKDIKVPKPCRATKATGKAHPVTRETRSALVSLTVSEATIDSWYQSLDLEAKAALFTANYRFTI